MIGMRDATKEEQESVNNYIKSISKPTGEDFYDLINNSDESNFIQEHQEKQQNL